jgi:hypothetical protein
MVQFQAYLWRMIVTVDYGQGGGASRMMPSDPIPPDSAVGQMNMHSQYLAEMTFCRGVNSFETYLAELLTMIFEARPETLKSNKMVTREFCVEHYVAHDLISALAEKTVNELTYHSLKDLADFFSAKLHLRLFIDEKDLENAALNVDIRNLITHKRGVVDRFFLQRHRDYAPLGAQIVFEDDGDVGDTLGTFVYFARQLDLRASEKFKLKTLLPIPGDQAMERPDDLGALSDNEKWDIADVRQWCKSAHVQDSDALAAFHGGRGVFDVLPGAVKLEQFISKNGLADQVQRSPDGNLPSMTGLVNNRLLHLAFKKRIDHSA